MQRDTLVFFKTSRSRFAFFCSTLQISDPCKQFSCHGSVSLPNFYHFRISQEFLSCCKARSIGQKILQISKLVVVSPAIGDFHKVAFYVIFSFCSQQLWMENAPSVVNHLLNPLAGESDAVKGIRIVQKGNNSAKAVFIESREGRHNGKMKRMRSASRTYN